jgi:cellulose synthase/poly-beta-1,6-N-acetylglucosamine synthase-like glycosyltransferase
MAKRITGSRDRHLFHKKFVDKYVLTLSFVLCLLFVGGHAFLTKHLSLYFVAGLLPPMLLIAWHKAYQFLYDFKLLCGFTGEYDALQQPLAQKNLPPVAFIIPSYHEPFAVAKMTFDSAVNIQYSGFKEIIVVDNSRDTSTDDFIKWKAYVENFNSTTRQKNTSATFVINEAKNTLKPGNLDLGQRHIREGEFVVVLDVDSTLPGNEDLLGRAISEFEADGKLGFIQFTMKATNSHFNDLTQAVAANQDLLRLRMISRGYGGYKIFEGHNGIWKKCVLDEMDGWTDYHKGEIIVTEDILKSAKMYSKGYYGKPLHIETGEWIPNSLRALESMWMRWMYGNSQVLAKYFRLIYCPQVSILEKFDITYHILHHYVTILTVLIAFLLQLFVPGLATNIFIVSTIVVPQLIGGITSYFTSLRKLDLPFYKKIQHIYSGFFMIETFIMYTQIKSDLNFMLGRRQGWKVTEKRVENSPRWKSIILSSAFHVKLGIAAIVICLISWIFNYDASLQSLHHHGGLAFVNANLFLCIIAFGKHRRKEHNDVESAIIDRELAIKHARAN